MQGKDKLINLKLMVFFILSKSRVIFRNLKVNLSKIIGINRFDLIIAKSLRMFLPSELLRAKENVTENFVIMHEINKGLFQRGV